MLLSQVLLIMHRAHGWVFRRWQVLRGLFPQQTLRFISRFGILLLSICKLHAKRGRVNVGVALHKLALLLCFIRIHVFRYILHVVVVIIYLLVDEISSAPKFTCTKIHIIQTGWYVIGPIEVDSLFKAKPPYAADCLLDPTRRVSTYLSI